RPSASSAMRAAVSVPVTVKCRIGIDDQDSEADLTRFIEAVAEAGCSTFIVHARKAWLKGLSPKENRELPPLDYQRVYRLKAARPDLTIVINGGIKSIAEARAHLAHVDGVMLGRAAYQTPRLLMAVDEALFGAPSSHAHPMMPLMRMIPYIERELARGEKLSAITRHVLGLAQGLPGARRFRRHLTEGAIERGAGVEVVLEALRKLSFETFEIFPQAAE
ncbi:MAG: tRNA dihydrouridine(20/20a) synthase DusA, partial [Rhodomicrobium sp.]|nr:tRNA dihydrouridine(20/20a) synthase DusA [Rhodomicrobium sp.]